MISDNIALWTHAKTALSFLITSYDFYYATYPNSQQKRHLQSPFENGPEHVESSHPSRIKKHHIISPNIFVIKFNKEDI